MLAVVDYGMGNLGSIVNTFRRLDVAAIVTSSPDDLRNADQMILPGVGSFDKGMGNLKRLGSSPCLRSESLMTVSRSLGSASGCSGSSVRAARREPSKASVGSSRVPLQV